VKQGAELLFQLAVASGLVGEINLCGGEHFNLTPRRKGTKAATTLRLGGFA
jgi:hypothetical protein